ncbi:MAG: ferredoxin [Gemmatimonadota bacterium]
MMQIDSRAIGDLVVRIDRTLCVGFGDCVDLAPLVFELDDDNVAVFRITGEISRDALIEACDACPVDAITVLADGSRQIVP